MGLPNFKNFALGELASSLTNAATSLSLKTGHGARFPASGQFRASIMAKSYGNAAKAYYAGALERVLVTAGNGTDSWTITRAQEGTTGVAFAADDLVFQGWCEADVSQLMPNEMTTRGDLIVRGASAPQRLALGAEGLVPMSDGTDLVFSGVGGGDAWSADTTNWDRIVVPGLATAASRAMTAGRLYANRFFVSQPITVGRLLMNVTTLGSGSNARAGIYLSTSKADMYPGALVVDAGEVSMATTGVRTWSLSQVLKPNRWYWVAWLCSTTAPTVTGFSTFTDCIGVDASGFSLAYGVYVAQTYGALPSTFPASATPRTDGFAPAMGIGFTSLT